MKYLVAAVLACAPARAGGQPTPDAVKLKKGEPAPFSGDLVPSSDLVELLIQARCTGPVDDLAACTAAREAEAAAARAKFEACEKGRLEAENKPPIFIEKPAPEPSFFERPMVVLVLGIALGGLIVYAGVAAAN